MKIRYIIVLLIILGLMLISFGIYKKNKQKDDSKIIRTDFIDKLSYKSESRKITICKNNTKKCPHALNEERFNLVDYKYDSDIFQKKVVNSFNKYVLDLYNETIKSTNYPGNCKMNDIFNYYKVKTAEERFHENSKVISFAILTTEIDYCNMTSKQLRPKVYNYSKKDDKLLDLDEIKNLLGITDVQIHEAIETRVEDYNSDHKTNYDYDRIVDNNSIQLYFLNNGELDANYYNKIDNSYDTAVIYNYKELLED